MDAYKIVAILVCGLVQSATAADLPRKASVVPAQVITTNPFYIGLFAGAGFSKTQNELTLDGIAQGPVSAYPTGLLAGVTVGYANNSGPIYWGAAVEAAYDFSRGDVGGLTPGTVLGFRKNGVLLQEGGELGINLATLGGYIPASAQPSSWPVPITVPSSVWGNLIIAARGGFAQRDVTLCATDPITLESNCGSKFINGPYVGGMVKAMISAQTDVFVKFDHVFWNSSFTPTPAVPLFSNTIAAKDENLVKVGFDYHF